MVGLKCRPEGGEDAEKVGAEHQKVGTPEGEDHQGDGYPPCPGCEPVGPDRGEREREIGTSEPSQRATDERMSVAIGGHVDPHRVGGCRVLAYGTQVQPRARPVEVVEDGEDQGPGGINEGVLVKQEGPAIGRFFRPSTSSWLNW